MGLSHETQIPPTLTTVTMHAVQDAVQFHVTFVEHVFVVKLQAWEQLPPQGAKTAAEVTWGTIAKPANAASNATEADIACPADRRFVPSDTSWFKQKSPKPAPTGPASSPDSLRRHLPVALPESWVCDGASVLYPILYILEPGRSRR